ncbi:sensor domain-containing diguanylate cyclase [Pseudomonas sp.]|uniref:sensor domain-containing diguanylate cyclase n=1 Tax=Pseudomonas sp. TaxID=306 RepID=UPI0025CCA192|nr:sensor domain-containing diguanylate cyclase [Pseudomonas sp.]
MVDEPTCMHRTGAKAQSAPRRTVRVTTLFVVFVCLSLLAVDFWLAWRSRDQELRQAIISNTNLASAVAEQMDLMVSEVGYLLDSIAFEMELDRSNTKVLAHLEPILKNHAASNRHVHGVFVYNAQGAWVVNSLGETPSRMNNADREYFIRHRENPSLETWVGKPITSRSTGIWIIPVSRRINDAAGNFAGVVLATINVDHISRILAKFEIGQHGAVTFALDDGAILMRRPFDVENFGKSIAGTQLQQDFASRFAGTYQSISPFDGIERLGSFQHTQSHALLVSVALSKHEMLREWRETTWIQTLWIVLLCIVTALAGSQVVRSVRQRVKVELDLGQTRDALTQANARLAQLASYDGLTGLANRRFFDETMERAFAESCRSGQPLGLVMVDVDYFKQYNDCYGHPAGDRCLQQVAQAIQSAARRPLDFVARYGGEEMVMVLPNTDAPGAAVVAEIARSALEAMGIPHATSSLGHVSASLGVAAHVPGADAAAGAGMRDAQALLDAADQALYQAKTLGRNRVVAHRPDAG